MHLGKVGELSPNSGSAGRRWRGALRHLRPAGPDALTAARATVR
jgi:hypothetical protein